jgi:DNA-binding NarL/FixJ family response regulator
MPMKSKDKISIIIADDHEFFRKGLASVIMENDRYELIGEAGNGLQLIEMLQQKIPDLIILDVIMPEMDGIEAMRKINLTYPLIKVIVLTANDDDDIILNMMKAGAVSLMDKNTNKREVYQTIEMVMDSEDFYFPENLRTRGQQLMEDQPRYASGSLKTDFSLRELEIIDLVCQDQSIKDIAEKLYISPRTVEAHRMRIMQKMNVKSAPGLVAYAFKHKLIMRK